jgi:hypothetical protein
LSIFHPLLEADTLTEIIAILHMALSSGSLLGFPSFRRYMPSANRSGTTAHHPKAFPSMP